MRRYFSAALVLLIAAALLSSCSFVRKSQSTDHFQKNDSSSKVYTVENNITEDTGSASWNNAYHVTETYDEQSEGIRVLLDPGKAKPDTNGNIVIAIDRNSTDKDVRISVPASSKSVTFFKTGKKRARDSTASNAGDSSHYVSVEASKFGFSEKAASITVHDQKKSAKTSWRPGPLAYLVAVIALFVLYLVWRYNKSKPFFKHKTPVTMKSFLLAALAATLLFTSCGRSRTPNDVIYAKQVDPAGFKPDPRGATYAPVEVFDTSYVIAPTWAQANLFAAGRGDHAIWQIIGLVVLAAFSLLIYGSVVDARWLPNFNDVTRGVLLLVFLSGAICCFKWQAAAIKWNNPLLVPKATYDKATRETGSTRPIWDSLEANCKINWGPYGCYK